MIIKVYALFTTFADIVFQKQKVLKRPPVRGTALKAFQQ